MIRKIFVALVVLLFAGACVNSKLPAQSSPHTPAEQEIRAALCDIDSRDYQAAQKKLERLLQSDPKNIYARKILLHVEAKQIKQDDKSPENIALIKKVIEGYSEALRTLQFTPDEKRQVESSILFFYRQFGEEALKQEWLRRASDQSRTPEERAEAYVVLASKSWDCSYRITSIHQAQAGKPVGPVPKPDIEKAKACVAEGMAHANQAITLDPENEAAWSYKTNLLSEGSKLAEIEGNQTQKASYDNQYNEALKHTEQLSAKYQAEREKEAAKEAEEQKKKESFTPEQEAEFSKELVEFKAENSLDEVVSELFPMQMELTSLVAPVANSEAKSEPTPTTRSQSSALLQEKRNWKAFAPDEDLTVDLPDNVGPTTGGYSAASDGVVYSIMSMARPPSQSADDILNTLARTYMGFLRRGWLSGGLANRFELKLLRKEGASPNPRKVYAYKLTSCTEKKDGVLMVQASQRHYYTIDVRGAVETDPRVQRFLGSLKVK